MRNTIRIRNKVKASSILIILSIALVACETEEEVAQGHLSKGIELLKKGDYTAAQLELKTAKQGSKSTAETYYYLALLDEKAKHYLAMEDNLQKTLDLESGHQAARLKLGKLQLLMGKVAKANDNANILLKENAQNTDAQTLKASVLFKQAQSEQSLVLINQVLTVDPLSIDALTLKSFIMLQRNEPNKALILIDKAIKLDEKQVALHFIKIKVHGKQRDLEGVINDYLELIKLFPENDHYKITLAKIYTKSDKKDDAEKLLRDFIAAAPGQIKPKILLLEFFAATAKDKVDPQIKVFTKELAQRPRQLLDFSKWMLTKGNTFQAEAMLRQVVAQKGNSKLGLEANILLAKLAFDAHDYSTTEKITANILSEIPDQLQAKLLQVRLLLVKGKYELAREYLNKVIWTHPRSDEALVLLAQLFTVQGNRQQAQLKFKAALELNPANIQAFIPVYNELLSKNDTKYARQLLAKALKAKPKQAVLLHKLIQLNIQEEKWEEATRASSQLARLPKQKSLAKFYFANIFQGQGDCEKAIEIYKELVNEFPEQLRILQYMNTCYITLNQPSEMVDFLNDHIQSNKQSVSAIILLSDLYREDKKQAKANQLLVTLIKEQPKAVQARYHLAKNYVDSGDLNKAAKVYQQGLEVFPDNIRLSLALASLYEKQQKYDKAVQIYETMRSLNPDLDVVNNNLAMLLIEHFATDENKLRALQLVEAFAKSEQVYFLDSYGWVLLHQGRTMEATKIFKKLTVKSPNIPVFRYHLAVAEFKNGNKSAALAQIDQAIELSGKGEDFPEQKVAEKLRKEIIAKIQGR